MRNTVANFTDTQLSIDFHFEMNADSKNTTAGLMAYKTIEEELAATKKQLSRAVRRIMHLESILEQNRDRIHVPTRPATDCSTVIGTAQSSTAAAETRSTDATAAAAAETRSIQRWLTCSELEQLADRFRSELLGMDGVFGISVTRRTTNDDPTFALCIVVDIKPPWAEDADEQIECVKQSLPESLWLHISKRQVFAEPSTIVCPL